MTRHPVLALALSPNGETRFSDMREGRLVADAAVMVQGTGSDVGKSLLVAGLARAFTRRGLAVRPFKPQNMSNNAAVTADGGEIGRAQALQALACGVPPSVHMNPVLLKPQTDLGAQVVVQGRVVGTALARDYQDMKPRLLHAVLDSFTRIADGADLVLVEGAGSPAEVNLRQGDIANMGFARAAGVPVVLVADIDRGGAIASIVGTQAVLDPADRAMVRGYIVNRFRGDPSLFDDGIAAIATHTGWPCFGVVPWLPEARLLPAEDAQALERGGAWEWSEAARQWDRAGGRRLKVAVPHLARIANFDDLDPLRLEPAVELLLVPPGRPLPGDADLIVLPGSKATIADLRMLRAEGWDIDLTAHVRRGGRVLGLCGGYQMLGRSIADPDGLEGPAETVPGLGLLDVETVLAGPKTLRRVTGSLIAGGMAAPEGGRVAFEGYEIHMGRTAGPDRARPLLGHDDGTTDGAMSPCGRVAGTYVHGLFDDDRLRRALLAGFGIASALAYGARVQGALDAIADALESHLDLDALLQVARTPAIAS